MKKDHKSKKTTTLFVNFGEELKHAKIQFLKVVPVTETFDNTKLLGEATVRQEGESITAELNIVNRKEIDKRKHILECGVGGTITEIKDNIITGFDLRFVSVQFKQDIKVEPLNTSKQQNND